MTEITQRFINIIDDIQRKTELTQTQIERRCEMSCVLSNIRKRGVEPSLLTCCKLMDKFPEYSTDYLLVGRGPMIKSPSTTSEMAIRINELEKRVNKLMKLNMILQEHVK